MGFAVAGFGLFTLGLLLHWYLNHPDFLSILTALGCGAHLSSLRRSATGGFDVKECITIEDLEAMNEEQRLAHLLPVDAMLDGHVKIDLDTVDAQRFTNGLSITLRSIPMT